MSSSFGGLSIGISAVFAQQRALDVTGQNISNVNTPGYSRQIINHTASSYDILGRSGNGQLMQSGTGVDVQEIKQYRDEFLDKKMIRENKSLGYWDAKKTSIEELENIFNDNSEEGFQSVMNNFWDSWEQLSNPTGGLTSRALVKENAIAFIETVQNMDTMLTDFRKNKDTEINENISALNSIAKQIADLNMSIKKTEAGGVVANDYRDQRNKLIDQLSKMANIQVYEGDIFTIGMEGQLLVEDTSYEQIAVVPDVSNNGFVSLEWQRTGDKLEVSGGSLKAMFETRDDLVDGFRDKLDQLVQGVAMEVNAIHKSGYGVSDNTQRIMFINSLASTDTTKTDVGIDLTNIAFNPELNDFDNIAAASDAPPNAEDNRIALAIATIRTENLFSDTNYEPTDPTLQKYNSDEFYRSIISEIGTKGLEAVSSADASKILTDQIDQRRQAISSVSLDEEMSNLIRYEHSYNAAARIVNAMDEMLEVIVNKIGVVGR